MGNTVISGILFQPPSPPNALRFLEDDLLNKKKDGTAVNNNQSLLSQMMKQKNICVKHIWLYSPTSRDGNEWNLIPAIHITHTNDVASSPQSSSSQSSSSSSSTIPDPASQKYTLLYSHGNAEDIGLISAFMIDMARLLHVNILCYDYSGYGMSVDTEYVCQFFREYGRELEFWKKYRSCTSGAALGARMVQQHYGEIPARNGHVCRYSRDLFVAPMVHPRAEERIMTDGNDLHSFTKEATNEQEEDNDAYGFTNTCSCNDDTTSGQFASSSTPAATTTSMPSPVSSFANEVPMNAEEYSRRGREQQHQYQQQQLLSRHNWTMPIPSDTNCYANIQSAYDYLTKVERTCPPHHVILYGKSVGSGPTCWLSQRLCSGGDGGVDGEEDGMCDSVMCNAETRDPVESGRSDGPKVSETAKTAPRLGGVVLHSPFLSVIRVVLDVGFTPIGDLFPNIDRVGDFKCPVYVIHGSHDAIVPFYHGQTLFQSLPDASKVVPFWAHGAGHNNIEMDMPTAYIKRLQQFIRQCDRLIYPKGNGIRSRRSKSMNASSSNGISSNGVLVEEQTRQMKKLAVHLTSQGSNAQTMSSCMMHKGGAANNTQTSKQRKQKGTLVLRPFHTQTRAPPPPPPSHINKQLMNEPSVGDHTIDESGVGDNSTTLVLTSNGVHSRLRPLQPHEPSRVYHHSSTTPFSIDSSATTTSLSSYLSVQQQHSTGNNHSVMYSKQQLIQPQQYEVYRSLNQQQHQHAQHSPYRTLNSA